MKTKAELIADNTKLLQRIDALIQELEDCRREKKQLRITLANFRNSKVNNQTIRDIELHMQFHRVRAEAKEAGQTLSLKKARNMANDYIMKTFGKGYGYHKRTLIEKLKDD